MASGTVVGIDEAKLWSMADALRNNMDAAEYKHVVLGLIFLKYISDAFEAKHAELEKQRDQGADPEDPDEYRAASIFWVPKEARWAHLKGNAPQPTIGTIVDDAMTAIERDNPSLKGVLPKDYGRPGLDKQRLGQLINLVSDIGLGSPADRAKDVLGRVYEYFLAQFASAEGKKGGQFYTPSHVVRILVEMLAPYKGRVYDPCCGSGGMFVSSEKFIEAHSGRIGDISIYGQESNYTTWRLAKMNLAIRGIDAQIAHGDTFHWDGGRNGVLLITKGKTKAARRLLPLSPRVRVILENRWKAAGEPGEGWVWPAETKAGHINHDSLKVQHKKALKLAKIRPFEVYCIRHTFLTRLGESGCDVWTLARVAGHSNISISQRYVHPSEDAVLNALSRLSGHNSGHSAESPLPPQSEELLLNADVTKD